MAITELESVTSGLEFASAAIYKLNYLALTMVMCGSVVQEANNMVNVFFSCKENPGQ